MNSSRAPSSRSSSPISAPKASSRSAVLARQAKTRSPRVVAASTANDQSVVLPIPASPSITMASGRGRSRSATIASRSASRPMISNDGLGIVFRGSIITAG